MHPALIAKLEKEVEYHSARSGGKGGQHVNKAETKVELLFDVNASQALSDEQKRKLFRKLGHRINKEGVLRLSAERSRSQEANKKAVRERFFRFMDRALRKETPRKRTRPPKWVKEKRIRDKKERSEKKKWRKPPDKD